MKRNLLLVIGFGVVLLVAAVGGYLKGRKDALIDDFKTYHANLISLESKGAGQDADELREFVKARYYYFANRIPRDWLPLARFDYGPVNTNRIADLAIGKGLTTASEEYRRFKEATQPPQARD